MSEKEKQPERAVGHQTVYSAFYWNTKKEIKEKITNKNIWEFSKNNKIYWSKYPRSSENSKQDSKQNTSYFIHCTSLSAETQS
jgi:hypothetical protein